LASDEGVCVPDPTDTDPGDSFANNPAANGYGYWVDGSFCLAAAGSDGVEGFTNPICMLLAAAETSQLSTAAPPCQDNWGNIDQTFEDLGANILVIASKNPSAQGIASLGADIQADIAAQMATVMSAGTGLTSKWHYYQGGHFNLDITAAQIAGLGAGDSQAFLSDFATNAFGGTWDGTRQPTVTGSSPNVLQYTLHSHWNKSGTDVDFHFDHFSPYSLGGAVGHPVWDWAYGTWAHPCLDPAWN
jgi:hypothetical protein